MLKFGLPGACKRRFSTVLFTTRLRAAMPASLGDFPFRISSTIKKEQSEKRFASPRPVEPAAPTSPSTYRPAPRMGESPTRPGILKDRPLVVVQLEMLPARSMALQL